MQNWCVKSKLQCFANIPEKISVNGHTLSFKLLNASENGPSVYLSKIIVDETEADKALIIGSDLSNTIADRISYLSNAPVWINCLSAAPESVEVEEKFTIATFYGFTDRSRTHLTAQRFLKLDQAISEKTHISSALRYFRDGLSNHDSDPYKAYTSLWTASEYIASHVATRENRFVKRTCQSCKTEQPPSTCVHCGKGMKDNRPSHKQILTRWFNLQTHKDRSEGDVSAIVSACTKMRGSLLHGGKPKDHEQRERTIELMSDLLPVTATGISEETGVKPQCNQYYHLGSPFLTFESFYESEKTPPRNMENIRYQVRGTFSVIPPTHADTAHFSQNFGVRDGIVIDPLAWPELKHAK